VVCIYVGFGSDLELGVPLLWNGLIPTFLRLLVFLPFFWALAGLLVPENRIKNWILAGSVVTLLVSLFAYQAYQPTGAEFSCVSQQTGFRRWAWVIGWESMPLACARDANDVFNANRDFGVVHCRS